MLTDVLDWGLADISAKLDAQSKLLQQTVAALESPRTTYANEARRMGIERFHLGWYDEAAVTIQADGAARTRMDDGKNGLPTRAMVRASRTLRSFLRAGDM